MKLNFINSHQRDAAAFFDTGKASEPEHIDSYSYHEVSHTTDIIQNMIEDHLRAHPVMQHHTKWMKKLDKAQEALGELYQLIGQVDYDNLPKLKK